MRDPRTTGLTSYASNSKPSDGQRTNGERVWRPAQAQDSGRYRCSLCKDLRWVYHDVEPTHPEFGKAHKCRCWQQTDSSRQRAQLRQLDGLTERERSFAFDDLLVNEANQAAIEAVRQAVQVRRGLVTLQGAGGIGKTSLLVCAVNDAREREIQAVYSTVSDVLQYLRSAYDPQQSKALNFDHRWELLVNCEVLALDEFSRFATTEWALERFHRLIDERWRHMDHRLTLVATNSELSQLDPTVLSRLQDGRAKVLQMAGQDMRRADSWDE